MEGHHSHFNVSSQPGSGGNLQQHFVPNSMPPYQPDINALDPSHHVALPVMDSVDVAQQYYQLQQQTQLQQQQQQQQQQQLQPQQQQQQIPFQLDPATEYYYNPQTGQTFSIARPQQLQFQQAQLQSQGPALMFMQPQRVAYQTSQQPVTMQMQPQIQQGQPIEQQHHQISSQHAMVNQHSLSASQVMTQNVQDDIYSLAQPNVQVSLPQSNNSEYQDGTNNSKRLKLDPLLADANPSVSDVDMSPNSTEPLVVPEASLVKLNQPVTGISNNGMNDSASAIRDFQHPFNHSQGHMHYHEPTSRADSAPSVRFEYEDPHSFAPPNSEELFKNAGQMLMVGIGCGDDGETPIEQIKELITKYGAGNIILASRHMKDAPSTRELILELQQCAKDAGHELPLNIAIDQENGMLNNLNDDDYITQFPGAMAMVATQSQDMARDVAKATGLELKALGINWTLGPVVDVLSNSTNKLLGVRTMGDDPKEVTQYALAYLEGYADANIATCAKHFPGYGNANVDETLALPIVYDTIEQLETASLIPYRQIIKKDVDAIMVGSCALPKITRSVLHACLSEKVVRGILREDMKYNGVIVSECLDMKSLYEDVGVRQGAVLAVLAGCDVIIVCSSYRLQLEALSGILGAVSDGIITVDDVRQSAERILNMKRKHLSWEETLNPPPLESLKKLHISNQELAKDAYERSITILRDHSNYIPLTNTIEPDADILLLTPLVIGTISRKHSMDGDAHQHQNLLAGEDVFHDFGKYLSRCHTGKITHTSYTDKGMSPLHENLIEKAKTVIVVTTDASRNTYQVQFCKTIGIMCTQQRKPMIAIAASSPYDLALDRGVGTYICLYEFTPQSLETAARVLFGKLQAKGRFPGSGSYQSVGWSDRGAPHHQVNPKRRWLVEKFSGDPADFRRLKILWESCFPDRLGIFEGDYIRALRLSQSSSQDSFNESGSESQTHFIVRNSSTHQLYGFCATWVHDEPDVNSPNGKNLVGCILMLFVDPFRRSRSIGQSLHERAMRYLISERQVSSVRLGSRVPSYFEGIPLSLRFEDVRASASGAASNDHMSPMLSHKSRASISTPLSTSLGATSSPHTSLQGPVGSFSGNYNPIDLVEWFRHVGWNIPRAAGVSATDTVHTLEIDGLKNWTPHSVDLRRLTKAGIKLRLAGKEDAEKVLDLVKRSMNDNGNFSQVKQSKMAGLWRLYKEVMEKREANIILAVSEEPVVPAFKSEPDSGSQGTAMDIDSENEVQECIHGSAIIFSRSSSVAYSMPWLLEFDSARVGGMSGIISEPSPELVERLTRSTHSDSKDGSEDAGLSKSHRRDTSVSSQSFSLQKDALLTIRRLRSTIVWGVVGCGLQAFKDAVWQTFRGREFDRCCIDGIDGPYVETLRRMGFQELKRFLEVCEYGPLDKMKKDKSVSNDTNGKSLEGSNSNESGNLGSSPNPFGTKGPFSASNKTKPGSGEKEGKTLAKVPEKESDVEIKLETSK